MKKKKLNRNNILMCNISSIIQVLLVLSTVSCNNQSIYMDTSSINYKQGRVFKILSEKLIETEYFNLFELKISMNLPIDSQASYADSSAINYYVMEIVRDKKIKKGTYIGLTVFNETKYTNKVQMEKKGTLFCEFSPCIYVGSQKYE